MQSFFKSETARELKNLHLPRYQELPALELYMDQVISVIDGTLSPLFPQSGGPILTPTMINNYVKQKIVEPPVKKRYNREHLAYFLVVALLKPVFSISEIRALLQRQMQVAGTDVAYNRFCTELEESIAAMMNGTELQKPLPPTGEADLLRATVISLVNKIYVEKFLEYAAGDPEAELC